MDDRQKFNEIMTGISERYEKTWGTALIKTIWSALKPYSNKQCEAAFVHVLLRCRFWSNVLPDLMDNLEAQNGAEIKAQLQADLVLKYLADHGADSRPIFDDPVTALLMSTRWKFREWGMKYKSEDKWWRINFVNAHQDYSKVKNFKQLGHSESRLLLDKVHRKITTNLQNREGDRP